MTLPASRPREDEWMDYYDEFDYFAPIDVRDGCHPRIMLHDGPAKKAIVLVHGLSDSPYFVASIGRHFLRETQLQCLHASLAMPRPKKTAWHGIG